MVQGFTLLESLQSCAVLCSECSTVLCCEMLCSFVKVCTVWCSAGHYSASIVLVIAQVLIAAHAPTADTTALHSILYFTERNWTALHFIVLHTALQCTTLHCRQVIARQVNHNQQYLGIFRRNYTALYSVQCKVCTVEFTMFYVHSKHLQLRSCCSAKSKHTCKTKNGIRQYVNSLFR